MSDESGNLKNLLEHKSENATGLLKARHSFILIKVHSKCSSVSLNQVYTVIVWQDYLICQVELEGTFSVLASKQLTRYYLLILEEFGPRNYLKYA